MKKSEMEQHWLRYTALANEVIKAEEQHNFSGAVELGEASWEHVEGALRFRKLQPVQLATPEVAGIDIVLRYAPILFAAETLDRLETFCIEKRRFLKGAGCNYDETLAAARDVMWRAHALWTSLEQQRNSPLAVLRGYFAGNDEGWHLVIRTWTLMSAVSCVPVDGKPHLELSTRLDLPATAKCPRCGTIAVRPKGQWLEPAACPACQRSDLFVVVTTAGDGRRT